MTVSNSNHLEKVKLPLSISICSRSVTSLIKNTGHFIVIQFLLAVINFNNLKYFIMKLLLVMFTFVAIMITPKEEAEISILRASSIDLTINILDFDYHYKI